MMRDREKPGLDAAYALQTPQDNRRLYADWADSYDEDFAARMAYRLPQNVAEILAGTAAGGPVLDVGAGTGLVGQAFAALGRLEMHALDLSGEMLAVAMAKGHYARAIEADLTKPLDMPDNLYGAVVSSGTFTHGHVGPDALGELMRVARSGAHFVLSVNAEHYHARGFAAFFDALAPRIEAFDLCRVNIYGAGADAADHAGDTALIAVFRKR